MELADRDEVELVAPTKTFVVEYEKLQSFWHWTWKKHVRERVTMRTLSLRELQQASRVYTELEKKGPVDVLTALVVLIGLTAYYLTPKQLEMLWAAHCELNLIPKGEAAPKFPDLRTPPSSADSDVGPSTLTEAVSST